MTHLLSITHISILLVAVVVRLSNANVLINFTFTIATRRRPRRRRSSRYTPHAWGTVASLFPLAARDAVKRIQGRLAPK
jgi:hypothetical protein